MVSLLCLALQSCNFSSEQHQLYIYYPNGVKAIAADQTQDSLRFFTYDSWKLSTTDNWISIVGDASHEIKNPAALCDVKYDIQLQPNTSKTARLGYVQVRSYYENPASAIYYQTGWLDIIKPTFKGISFYDEDTKQIPKEVSFTLADSCQVVSDSLWFSVYNNWTLEYVGEQVAWVKMDRNQGKAGENKVYLTFEPNEATEDRQTVVRLTSGPCSTDMTIKQYGAKKKAE